MPKRGEYGNEPKKSRGGQARSTVFSIRFLLISIRFRDFVGFPESQCAVKISKKLNTESNREKKRRRKAVM